ncbi:MAG: hypothetical protein ABIP46_11435 [Polaromonas sp.]
MKSIPLAAAMTAAMLFGAVAHAQSGTTTPPGSTKPQDAVTPTPGNSSMPARTDANNSSGNPVAKSATMTPGTTKAQDNVSPSPTAGNGSSTRMAAPGMNGSMPADPNKTGIGGTTKAQDNVSPAPMGGMAKDADARTMAKSDKKSTRAAKRAARKAKKTTDGTARNNSDAGPQPVSGLGAVSPTPSK